MEENNSNLIVAVDQLLPEELFLIPLRFRPIFPGLITPLVIPKGKFSSTVEKLSEKNNFFGLVLQKDDTKKKADPHNIYEVGTVIKVIKKIKLPEGGIQILVSTIQRFAITKITYNKSNMIAKVKYYKDPENKKDKEINALTRAILTNAKEVMAHDPFYTEEIKLTLVNVNHPGKIADFTCSVMNLEKEEFQEILETFDIKKRLVKTLSFLTREMELIKLQQKIQGKVSHRIDQNQKEYFLKEQLQAIRSELGIAKNNKEKNAEYYKKKLKSLSLSEEAHTKVSEEIEKLEYVDPYSNEYGVIRNYLDIVFELPWKEPTYKNIDIEKAKRILNRQHYGLEDVKNRIVEHLAVKTLRKNEKGSIICFVGPPGVGKTSLGKSIAQAMGKKFFRFSLGGMRDEAEIKGHRRTYVGAMSGKIIQALKVTKAKDSVLMLDEIDKLGISFQGDPASALLEVLDPEQNKDFRDYFLDIPFDLSFITFITTANTLDKIPEALLDRMEVIRLPGYILEEKIKIAKKYIIPRMIKNLAIPSKKCPQITTLVLKETIDSYSRESGVRSLEKNIEKIFRKAATSIVTKTKFPEQIQPEDLKEILGPPRFSKKEEGILKHIGTVTGLAWTSLGGETLQVEAKAVPGKGKLKLTGHLGKVMEESASIALTYAKAFVNDDNYWFLKDVHIHVPDGATPKDGPSAGITISTALVSLYKNKKIKNGYGMTGEIRLTGEVLPIGGLKEKTIAARRAGIKKIIFPKENEKDWEELPPFLKKAMQPFPVENYEEVAELLF